MRTAVIGVGTIARHHLAALRALPSSSLVAVCDLSQEAAQGAAQDFGAGAWFTDVDTMLGEASPDIVHVTTPPQAHFPISLQCLDGGAHVFVEKPAAVAHADVVALLDRARSSDRVLVEDLNYLFNPPILRLLELVRSGEAGAPVHVEVGVSIDLLHPRSAFADPAYPANQLRGGPITDFLPHLASLAHAFIGPHRGVDAVWLKRDTGSSFPSDELRATVEGERCTGSLFFSANSRPDAMWVRLEATKLRARANLFEPKLVLERTRSVPRPLGAAANGLHAARIHGGAAVANLVGKVTRRRSSLDGLTELIERTHAAIAAGSPPPVSLVQIQEVSALVDAVVAQAPPA